MVHLKKDAGHTFSYDELKEAVEKHKPTALFLCQASRALKMLRAWKHVEPTTHAT